MLEAGPLTSTKGWEPQLFTWAISLRLLTLRVVVSHGLSAAPPFSVSAGVVGVLYQTGAVWIGQAAAARRGTPVRRQGTIRGSASRRNAGLDTLPPQSHRSVWNFKLRAITSALKNPRAVDAVIALDHQRHQLLLAGPTAIRNAARRYAHGVAYLGGTQLAGRTRELELRRRKIRLVPGYATGCVTVNIQQNALTSSKQAKRRAIRAGVRHGGTRSIHRLKEIRLNLDPAGLSCLGDGMQATSRNGGLRTRHRSVGRVERIDGAHDCRPTRLSCMRGIPVSRRKCDYPSGAVLPYGVARKIEDTQGHAIRYAVPAVRPCAELCRIERWVQVRHLVHDALGEANLGSHISECQAVAISHGIVGAADD